MPGYLIQYFDETGKTYKEVTTTQPLPVTTIGGGAGGAEEVEITQPLPAGTNNIGKVDVNSLPALPTGTNAIGTVGVTSLPALPAGTNEIGTVGLAAGTNAIGTVGITGAMPDTNADGAALPSTVRTASANSADLINSHGIGAIIVLDVTSTSGGPSVTLSIQGKDTTSGKYIDILAGVAVTAISTTVYKIHPNLVAAANSIASDILPRTWRVVMTHANGDSIAYSVGYSIV